MSIKFERITAGMHLLDIHRTRMGNTTMSKWGCWDVYIVSVDQEKRCAVVRWNYNQPETWYARELTRLYVKETKAYLDQCERQKKGGWW